jgi:hypothetical protein
MMRPPPPRLIICLAAIRVPKNALLRLTAITLSYCASLVSRTEVRVSMPALFTKMSSRPNLSTAASTSFFEVGTLAHVGRDADGLAAELADLALEHLGRSPVVSKVPTCRRSPA